MSDEKKVSSFAVEKVKPPGGVSIKLNDAEMVEQYTQW